MKKKIENEMGQVQSRLQNVIDRLTACLNLARKQRAEAKTAEEIAELDKLIYDLNEKLGEIRFGRNK